LIGTHALGLEKTKDYGGTPQREVNTEENPIYIFYTYRSSFSDSLRKKTLW